MSVSRSVRRVCLGDILKLRKEVVYPRDNPQGHAVFVGLEHVESNTGRRIGSVELDLSKLTGRKPRFYAGDIVYGYLRPYLNKVWVAEFDGLCSVDQYVYQVDPETADAQYVAWFMRSPVYLSRAPIETTPGQLPRIRTDEVSGVEFDLPQLGEQRQFVESFTQQMAAVDRAREAAEAGFAASAALVQAVPREVFASDEAVRWPKQSLGDIADITGGIQKTPDRRPTKLHRPYLTVRNVQTGYLDLTDVQRFEVTEHELKRFRLMAGDLLIVEGNGSLDQIGRNALFRAGDGEEWIHQNHIIRVRLSPAICRPEFASVYFNSPEGRRQMVEKARTMSGLYGLSAQRVAALELPTPSLAKQDAVTRELAKHVAAATALREAASAQCEAISVLPTALLRRAFNGES